ncbi:hypothetical protein D3C71_1635060 [compost metagenome]
MQGPGHRQHRHRFPGRHGRLRHDRAVRHQRQVGRPHAAVHLRGGRFPVVPDRGPGPAGGAHSHAGAGGGDDHGVDRHLPLAVISQLAIAPLAIVGRDAGDGRGRGVDARSGPRRTDRRVAERPVLRGQGPCPDDRDGQPVRGRRDPHVPLCRPGVFRLRRAVCRGHRFP